MWRYRHEMRSPRMLSSAAEAELRSRRSGVWGVERKLRWIVAKYPESPWDWSDVLVRWVDRQADRQKVWDLVELVLIDWLVDPNLDESIRHTIRQIFDAIPEWSHYPSD